MVHLLQKTAVRVYSSAALSVQFCTRLHQVFIHLGTLLFVISHNNCLALSLCFTWHFCTIYISSVLTMLNPHIPKGVACRTTN